MILFGMTVILSRHPYGVLRGICQPSIFKVPASRSDVSRTRHLFRSFLLIISEAAGDKHVWTARASAQGSRP
jgi:hypothetical protein